MDQAANAREDRRPAEVEAAILRLSSEQPALGQAAVAERLRRDGLPISASGVRYIWQKHGLETAVKRLQALASASRDGVAALTDSQRGLLERGALTAQLVAGDAAGEGGGEPLDRRQVILDAAAALFAEQGYDRSSIRDIASRVGLLPGSIYHYFASKDELYLAVHGEGFRRLMAAVEQAIAESTDPWERLTRACEVHVAAITSGTYIDRVTGHSLAMTGNTELFAKIRPIRETYENVYRGLIDALPLAPGTDRTLLRLLLLSVLNWVHVWYREGKRSTKDIADAMVDMVRRGVQAPNA
jgi:TetR/AcrR family transcriptional regulator, cholesterol catabolism regulator